MFQKKASDTGGSNEQYRKQQRAGVGNFTGSYGRWRIQPCGDPGYSEQIPLSGKAGAELYQTCMSGDTGESHIAGLYNQPVFQRENK